MGFDPDDFNPHNFDDDDFDINEFLSDVDFDDDRRKSAPEAEEPEDRQDTGEYTPIRRTDTFYGDDDYDDGYDDYDDDDRHYRERKHVRKSKRNDPRGVRALRKTVIVLIYLLVITLASYILATLGWHWANDLLALNKEEMTATVTLDESWFTETETTDDDGNTTTVSTADMDEVADTLEDNGFIQYKWLFKLFAKVTHKDTKLVAGTYELSTTMDYSALLRNMGAKSTTRATVKVRVVEGSTVEEIIQLLVEQGVADQASLEDAAANYDYQYDFLDSSTLGQANRLEGFLFPDTYEFYVNSDAATALGRMLSNFDSKLTDELRTQISNSGYTLKEIITVASIIEKETDGYDQSNISSVIYNRLTNTGSGTNGYLQMDSTIQYVLDERKEKLTTEDLAIDSPYNTYLYKGLPAGPISCPGMDAIEAAVYPASTNYFYFVLGDDGSTHFFSDYNEFVAFSDAQTGEIQTTGDDSNNVEG
jgi:UPF0755 protein